jgi:hypothetical protein
MPRREFRANPARRTRLAQRLLYALAREDPDGPHGNVSVHARRASTFTLEREQMNARKQCEGGLAFVRCLALATIAVGLSGCGGDKVVTPPPPTPPPTPAAAVTGTGAGALVLHPSRDRRFAIAMATPIRISETAGGAADWGFARIQFFNRGVEIERTELTATDIRAAGYGRIAANSNQVYNVVFRFNSDQFDRIDITLGFSDVKDARQFTVSVPGSTFTSVDLNFDPLSLDHSRTPL